MPAGPRFDRLEAWLDWQQRLHPSTIELGLERVGRVLARTGWRRPDLPVVTVGGTNGKGSTVALLDAVLRAAGHRVGTFTSPHLVDYCERIRLDGAPVGAPALMAVFERIGDALGPDSLTYFEFNTLAALLLFERAGLDALVLEVGLGGRLDAVNLVDADVAIVASVGLDHMDYLGPDVESIGREKAGIFRPGRPAIFGMPDPPRSVREEADRIGAELLVRGERFDGCPRDHERWDFLVDGAVVLEALPKPALPGRVQVGNAATALLALTRLTRRLPLTRATIERGLREVALPGRFQRVADARGFEWVFDVAHNPGAAGALAENLRDTPVPGRTLAVCGMLADKDVPGVVATLRQSISAWYAATPEGPRAIDAQELARRAKTVGIDMRPVGDVATAMRHAAADARRGDRVVVFGSFHTVGPALVALGVPL
jgi:dihydrofolate synthase/folylpolyglutamate synthase